MTFHVHWSKEALDDLSSVWLNADSRKRTAITAAAREIDRVLQVNPKSSGESRPEGHRIYFESPLGLLFTVDTHSQVVTITQAWLVRKHHA